MQKHNSERRLKLRLNCEWNYLEQRWSWQKSYIILLCSIKEQNTCVFIAQHRRLGDRSIIHNEATLH